MFVDDIILFAEASIHQVQVVKGVLDLFCQALGQRVNYHKSTIVFSANVSDNLATNIAGFMNLSRA